MDRKKHPAVIGIVAAGVVLLLLVAGRFLRSKAPEVTVTIETLEIEREVPFTAHVFVKNEGHRDFHYRPICARTAVWMTSNANVQQDVRMNCEKTDVEMESIPPGRTFEDRVSLVVRQSEPPGPVRFRLRIANPTRSWLEAEWGTSDEVQVGVN